MVGEQSVPAPKEPRTGKTTKAAASKTNAGAVSRGDTLAKERPDLAEKVRMGKMKPAEARRRAKRRTPAFSTWNRCVSHPATSTKASGPASPPRPTGSGVRQRRGMIMRRRKKQSSNRVLDHRLHQNPRAGETMVGEQSVPAPKEPRPGRTTEENAG
jgi:hypothetical protein